MTTRYTPLALLGQRRFLPFFVTQFLGAFNDNVFKNALLLLLAYHAAGAANINLLVNLSAALFILPFFLLSALAGQLAERSEKAAYIRRLKLLEIVIMLIAAVGFFLSHTALLMTALFLTGAQSALFGPAKYSILPQQLAPDELLSGNALVESGTFLAILLGTVLGGLLIALGGANPLPVSVAVVVIALCGWLVSRRIPPTPVSAPDLVINWNLAAETGRIIGYLRRKPDLFFPVLAISWFWFYGALFLTQLPNYTRTTLGADGTVATALLAAFSIGIGAGSMLCDKLCERKIEPGLVPLGALGLSCFALDLGFAQPGTLPDAQLISAPAFLAAAGNWRVLVDLMLISLCGGIYVVPLYTLIQSRCNDSHRSRVVAANNVLNAIFIVGAALFALVLLGAGLDIPRLFQLAAVVNALVLVLLCRAMPEFPLRTVAWLWARLRRRVRSDGFERIPEPALLVCESNDTHTLLLVLWAAARRMRLATDEDAPLPRWLSTLLRWNRAIVLRAGADSAHPQIALTLAAAQTVCVVGANGGDADSFAQCHDLPVFAVTINGNTITADLVSAAPASAQTNPAADGYQADQAHD